MGGLSSFQEPLPGLAFKPLRLGFLPRHRILLWFPSPFPSNLPLCRLHPSLLYATVPESFPELPSAPLCGSHASPSLLNDRQCRSCAQPPLKPSEWISGGILAGMRGRAILSKVYGCRRRWFQSYRFVERTPACLASIALIRMPVPGPSDDGFGSAVGASDALSPSDFPEKPGGRCLACEEVQKLFQHAIGSGEVRNQPYAHQQTP